jgi:hypothetical protein
MGRARILASDQEYRETSSKKSNLRSNGIAFPKHLIPATSILGGLHHEIQTGEDRRSFDRRLFLRTTTKKVSKMIKFWYGFQDAVSFETARQVATRFIRNATSRMDWSAVAQFEFFD